MIKKKDVDVTIQQEDGSEKVVKIYVTPPSAKTVQRADRYKAKVWTECIEDGIKTKDELASIMEKRGIWTKEKAEQEASILDKIQELEKTLFLGDGKKKLPLSDGKKMAIQMRGLRLALRNLLIERSNLEQNTAEALADNARFDYIVALSTFYENGENVYKDIDDYSNKSSDEVAFAAASALAELMYAYDPRNEENLPENQWLKHFGMINEDLSLVDKADNLVDLEGRKINEFGHYINDEGHRIDVDGNLLDENGNYVITAQWTDDAKKTRGRPKKQPAKTES